VCAFHTGERSDWSVQQDTFTRQWFSLKRLRSLLLLLLLLYVCLYVQEVVAVVEAEARQELRNA
jgi:hypothetical protein